MKTKKLNINHLIVHLILLAGVAVVVFPFLWMILTSFKTSGEAMKIPPTIFPEKFVTTAYHTIVSSAIPFGTVYMNTIISTVVTTIVQIAFCSMAGKDCKRYNTWFYQWKHNLSKDAETSTSIYNCCLFEFFWQRHKELS